VVLHTIAAPRIIIDAVSILSSLLALGASALRKELRDRIGNANQGDGETDLTGTERSGSPP
jgi:hypothetical protein